MITSQRRPLSTCFFFLSLLLFPSSVIFSHRLRSLQLHSNRLVTLFWSQPASSIQIPIQTIFHWLYHNFVNRISTLVIHTEFRYSAIQPFRLTCECYRIMNLSHRMSIEFEVYHTKFRIHHIFRTPRSSHIKYPILSLISSHFLRNKEIFSSLTRSFKELEKKNVQLSIKCIK